MAQLIDVARAAGVSTATVSRALNEPAKVVEATRRRVQQAMRQLDYHPNRVAGRLRQRPGRRHILGVIIPEIENPHFAEIVRGVEDAAQAERTAVILCNSDDDRAKQAFYLDLLRGESVDGVIVPPIRDRDPALLAAIAAGLPTVVIDRRLRSRRVDSILVDNREGTLRAVKHLVDRGYRTIGHIAGPQQLSTSLERTEAWKEALAIHDLGRPKDYLFLGNNQRNDGLAGAEKLLSLPNPPRAIYISNNLMALGALEVIWRRGLRVPEDVAIVAFDDPPWAQAIRPALTTVRQPTREMGRLAVELLLRRLREPDAPYRHVLLGPELMIRVST